MGLQKSVSKAHAKGKPAIRSVITVPEFTKAGRTLDRRTEKAPDTKVRISAAERYQLIAKAAYLRAETRGFASGDELRDWLEAEAEVELLLDR